MYKLYKYTIFIVMWILIIIGFIYKDTIPSWIFIATWYLVNAMERLINEKVKEIKEEMRKS